MVEFHQQTNWLWEENERMRTRMEVDRAEQSRKPPRPFPSSRPGKGKEVTALDDIDLSTDDELSSCSSPLPHRLPSPNAAEAQSRKRPSSRSISVLRHRVQREPNRDQRPPTPAHQYVSNRAGGFPPPVPSVYLPFGAAPAPQMIFASAVQGPQDMLSTPLGQHILDYDLPAAFPYHPSPCTTVLPIRTITCYITTRQ